MAYEAVPLISVSRWSSYLSVQTYGLGCSGPLPRVFLLHPITSVLDILPFDINVMADSDSILDCQKVSKKSALPMLFLYTQAILMAWLWLCPGMLPSSPCSCLFSNPYLYPLQKCFILPIIIFCFYQHGLLGANQSARPIQVVRSDGLISTLFLLCFISVLIYSVSSIWLLFRDDFFWVNLVLLMLRC